MKEEGKMEATRQRTGQVGLALMLMVGVAAAAACVMTLLWWKAPAASGQEETASTDESFVVKCGFTGKREKFDPIVNPGGEAFHLHDFFGNTTTDANSTYETLRAGEPRAMILMTQRPTGSLLSPGPTAVAPQNARPA